MRLPLVLVVVVGAAVAACVQDIDPAHLPPMTFAVPAAKDWPVPQLAPAPLPGQGRIYVTDNLDDTVSIVDLDSAEAGAPVLLAKVPVGFIPVEREGPHHVTVDAAGEFYYFGISNFVPGSGSGPHGVHGAGTADGHMIKMRVDDNSVVATVRVEPNPGDVRLTPDGKTLLASHFDLVKITKAAATGVTSGPAVDSDLAFIDPVTMTRDASVNGTGPGFIEACPAAHGIAITPDSKTAILSCLDDEVAIVDLVAHTVKKLPVLAQPGTPTAPVCEPYALTLDGGTAWVSCYSSGEVIGVDIANQTLTGDTFQLPGIAVFGEVRNGTFVVSHQNNDGFSFYDVSGAHPAFLGTTIVQQSDCQAPHVAHFNEDGSKIFVVCEGDHVTPGTFAVYDATAPHAFIGKVELGIYPDDSALMRRAP